MYYEDDEDDYEDDEEQGEGIRLVIGDDGVMGLAPETVEMDKEEAEMLAEFLNENQDVRDRMKEFAEKRKAKNALRNSKEVTR